jgi:hypothetical protein
MSSSVNAPTTLLPITSVSSTGGNTALFEQKNDIVNITGGRKRKGSRKSKRRTTRRVRSRRRTAKRTFLSKWMAMGK